MTATWTCTTCFKSFSRKGDLTRHSNLHTGIKPYRCEDCGKRFSQFSGLKTHRNVHTKVKPFKCGMDGCTAAFGDPSSCTRHRKERHRTLGAYHCPVPHCKSSIKRRSAFKLHLKKHNISLESFDIDSMAPLLIPQTAPAKRKSVRHAPSPLDAKPYDNEIPKIPCDYPNDTSHAYYAHQSNAPSYYYPIPEPAANYCNSYSSNAWYLPNETNLQMGMQVIPNDLEQFYTFDSPSSLPELDFSLSPSPAPSHQGSISTPLGAGRQQNNDYFTVLSSPPTPSPSSFTQSPRLFFSEAMYAGQQQAHRGCESKLLPETILPMMSSMYPA